MSQSSYEYWLETNFRPSANDTLTFLTDYPFTIYTSNEDSAKMCTIINNNELYTNDELQKVYKRHYDVSDRTCTYRTNTWPVEIEQKIATVYDGRTQLII